MKYKFIILMLVVLITGMSVYAQAKSAQLYGYSQATVPGITTGRRIDENGNEIQKKTPDVTYRHFIYIVTPSTARLYPVEIWIKGEPFSAKAEAVTTPVTRSNPNMPGGKQKTVLVPQTKQKVLQLTPMPHMAAKSSAKAKTLAKKNELVVVYRQNGQTYCKVLEKITVLDPVAMQ